MHAYNVTRGTVIVAVFLAYFAKLYNTIIISIRHYITACEREANKCLKGNIMFFLIIRLKCQSFPFASDESSAETCSFMLGMIHG